MAYHFPVDLLSCEFIALQYLKYLFRLRILMIKLFWVFFCDNDDDEYLPTLQWRHKSVIPYQITGNWEGIPP